MAISEGPLFVCTYEPTQNFKDIEQHVGVCDANGVIVALTGPVEDQDSADDAALFASAGDLLVALGAIVHEITIDEHVSSGMIAALDMAEAVIDRIKHPRIYDYNPKPE